MAVHVSITRSEKENNMGVMRRFRQRVTEWGGVKKKRSVRYHSRTASKYVTKKSRLRTIARKTVRARLYKLGLTDKA
ncbi:MAG: hypothetical protein AAB458_00185 [Patescibacteria group bacterium]